MPTITSSHGAVHVANELANLQTTMATEAAGAGITDASLERLVAAVKWLGDYVANLEANHGANG